MSHYTRLVFAFALIACSGRPPTPSTSFASLEEVRFQAGRASHFSRVDEMTRLAGQVLAASFEMTPTSSPGVVTTEWSMLDARRWPGVLTRVAVEITDRHVTVRFQCRRDSESCSDRVPNAARLSTLAQTIADAIVKRSRPDYLLSRLRAYKEEACACGDLGCIEHVDSEFRTWALEHSDEWRDVEVTRAHDAEADRIGDATDACKEALEAAASPPYVPYEWEATGSKECDEYLLTFDGLAMRCRDKLGPAYDAMKQSRDAQVEAFAEWSQLDDASRRAAIAAAAEGCLSAADALRQSATSMGCSL